MKFHCVPKPLSRSCDTLQRKFLTPSPPPPLRIQDAKSFQSTGHLDPDPNVTDGDDEAAPSEEYKVIKMKPERWYKIEYPGRDGPLAYYSISICNICNRHNTKGKVSRIMKIFKRNKETDEYVDPKAYSDKFLETLKKKFILPTDESQVSGTWKSEQSGSSDV